MIALRLVRMIEVQSEKIARDLVRKIQTSAETSDLGAVPEFELRAGMRDMLQHLGDWLLSKTATDIESRYRELGARWSGQGVALVQSCRVVITTKETLWDFIQKQGLYLSGIQLYGEIELLWLLDQFFDRALCSVVEGYAMSDSSSAEGGRTRHPRSTEVNLAHFVP